MPIDEQLRERLPAAVDHVEVDVEAELASVLRRVRGRLRIRRLALVSGLAAAAVLVLVISSVVGEPLTAEQPVAPAPGTQQLDADRGSALDPAPLQPGRYELPFIGARGNATGVVDVPAGWGQDRLLLATGADLDPHLRRVELSGVDSVAADPCRGNVQAVDADAAAVVTALRQQRWVRPSRPEPASIDGVAGHLMQFRVPLGLKVQQCSDGQSLTPFGVAASHVSVFPGWTYRLWVLDVPDDPLVIMAAHGPQATGAEVREVTAMVEGLRIEGM